ncbi:DsbA family protein [Phaeovulum sp.]|jgi:protein-disulfide isomerase|uniref:DsbA family protein n=1 Tax=Phaeovulum sp. TaxID=2934796 RepID=UPI0027322618|nr:DsbA family protein [Phaeovulum sp.]MDP1670070.1 DsbA family protein [Phaeovulum sp.]MDZ4118312.1 DsbA family protein [Phaeovulum sp.]
MPFFRLATLALAATLAAGSALAFDPAAMTEAERTAFGAEIRRYLLEHPEVLVEAINVLDARQAALAAATDAQLVAAYAEALFNDGNSWAGGNLEGDVTVVEFMDYRCGYCRQAHPEVEELVKSDGNIRFIVKEFPILGPESDQASRFAIAIRQIGGDAVYKQAHDLLITLRGSVNVEALTRIAQDLGQDPAAVLARMSDPSVTAIIEANHALAQQMQISGTPSFVIGNEMLRGYLALDGMRRIVAGARG